MSLLKFSRVYSDNNLFFFFFPLKNVKNYDKSLFLSIINKSRFVQFCYHSELGPIKLHNSALTLSSPAFFFCGFTALWGDGGGGEFRPPPSLTFAHAVSKCDIEHICYWCKCEFAIYLPHWQTRVNPTFRAVQFQGY